MPLERQSCEECGNSHYVCPECKSHHVTPRDDPHKPSPTRVVDGDYGTEEVTYTHVCWDCGWREHVTVQIDREEA